MQLKQNDLEHLQDMMQRGEMTADQANVEKVRMMRVQLVTGRLPAQVRKSLNAAVKSGELCHAKKDGKKPEAYYHPTFEHIAKQERKAHELSILNALSGVMAGTTRLE
ncbi:MAG: hypothetical protein ACXWT0_00155 [Methylobacter sp.]